MGFEKPKGSAPVNGKQIPSRPLYLLRDTKTVYWVEGESDALTLWQQGLSVMCTPGSQMKKCFNTMALVAEQNGYKKVVCCGDDDEAGRKMNELSKIAVNALTSMEFAVLPRSMYGGMNDLNDAYVAGKLNIAVEKLDEIIPSATELTGWEGVYAKVIFSNKEEALSLIAAEMESTPDLDVDFVADLYSAQTMEELRKVWAKGTTPLQEKYVYLKDSMKFILAPAPPAVQQSFLNKYQ